MEQMKKMPLEGIRVVELATVVAAPTASRVLCAFGAEVIKVETRKNEITPSCFTQTLVHRIV